jgi:4'-phosphopantetheinyl transferase
MSAVILHDHEAHVWFIRTDAIDDARLLRTFEDVLSAQEKERWQRFTFEAGQRQYLISHGFLRLALSRYADVTPSEWRFVSSAYGKPEIVPGHAQDALRSLSFNLTHTSGLAACIVARDREVGVDAEEVDRQGREIGDELIRYCLSGEELACFRMVSAHEQKRAFLDYWTLKEAYLKARGFGLSLPVEAITFRWLSGIPHHGPVEASFAPAIDDNPQTWHFERFTPTPQHKIAVAVRRPLGANLTVIMKDFADHF